MRLDLPLPLLLYHSCKVKNFFFVCQIFQKKKKKKKKKKIKRIKYPGARFRGGGGGGEGLNWCRTSPFSFSAYFTTYLLIGNKSIMNSNNFLFVIFVMVFPRPLVIATF